MLGLSLQRYNRNERAFPTRAPCRCGRPPARPASSGRGGALFRSGTALSRQVLAAIKFVFILPACVSSGRGGV